MEDLSRELEKELKAHSRPDPVKKKIKTELYFIDEFGRINPVSWMRPFMFFLVFLTLASSSTAAFFVYFYTHGGAVNKELVQRLHSQEKSIQKLTSDKELLMARLVLSGNALDILPESAPVVEPGPEEIKKVKKNIDTPSPSNAQKDNRDGVKENIEDSLDEKTALQQSRVNNVDKDGKIVDKNIEPFPKIIDIEGIRVFNDGENGDLLVRFDIKNISVDSTNISGYVFVVLKPAPLPVSDWLILPTVAMDKGKPAHYKKGQYFSIAHFKPVNFRLKTHLSPEAFKMATVFVYDDDGGLMSMQDITLSESEESP